MTPAEMNKAIKAGELFYVKLPDGKEAIALKARSVGGLRGHVKVNTVFGWFKCASYRRPGSWDWRPLTPMGVMTWALNH